MNLRCLKLNRAYSISFNSSNVGNFFGVESKGLHQSSGKEKEGCCIFVPFLDKREIRQFHVVVVQRRQRNVQKGVMRVESCCFSCLNLLLFCRSRCRRCCRCVNSLFSAQQWGLGRTLIASPHSLLVAFYPEWFSIFFAKMYWANFFNVSKLNWRSKFIDVWRFKGNDIWQRVQKFEFHETTVSRWRQATRANTFITINIWHYSCPLSVYCRSIAFLLVCSSLKYTDP